MDGLPQGGGWAVGVELLGVRRRGLGAGADVFLARGLLRRRDALPLRGRGRRGECSALLMRG
ncbi:hypothetical protein ACWDCC_41080 [Streptomyces sp. NPDC001102]